MCDSSSELRLREAQNDGALGAKPPYRFEENARQPKRTGTWQFMSAAYINSQCTLPLAVADELEAFFHVLLFYALRFLPHTLGDGEVGPFIAEYFEVSRDGGAGKRMCGLDKSAVMNSGDLRSLSIRFRKSYHDLGSPLDTLLHHVLRHFGARYKIMAYERTIKQKTSEDKATPSEIVPKRPQFTLARYEDTEMPWWYRDDRPPLSPRAGPRPPNEETKKLAADLDGHRKVLGVFGSILYMMDNHPEEWYDIQAVQDQLRDY
ncbi:hypothetical protein VTO73DRAFT_12044 [Trametes versicolor]